MLYFWPGINSQIKQIVTSCAVCEKFTRNKQKEPLTQDELSNYPFHRVSMDLFEYAGRAYVALIDAYSGYYRTRFKIKHQVISLRYYVVHLTKLDILL